GTAEEAGVEPTEDAGRPPAGLKPARVTGPDALPQRYCRFPAPNQSLSIGRLWRSGKYLAAAQHDARVARPPGRPHLIEVLEDLDRQIAADAAAVLEGRRSECAFG